MDILPDTEPVDTLTVTNCCSYPAIAATNR